MTSNQEMYSSTVQKSIVMNKIKMFKIIFNKFWKYIWKYESNKEHYKLLLFNLRRRKSLVKFNTPPSKSNPSTQSKIGLWSQLPTSYLKTEIEKKPLQYSKWRERCQLIPKKPKIEKEWKRKWNCYKRKNRQ